MLARIETLVSNATTIKAATLNGVQDELVDVYDGSKTLKKVTVDGTGDADGSATPAGQVKSATLATTGDASVGGNLNIPNGSLTAKTGILCTNGGIGCSVDNLIASTGYTYGGATITATSAPTAAPTKGRRYADDGIFAFGRITRPGGNDTFAFGKNVQSMSYDAGNHWYVITLKTGVADYTYAVAGACGMNINDDHLSCAFVSNTELHVKSASGGAAEFSFWVFGG